MAVDTDEVIAAKATNPDLWIGQGPYGLGSFDGLIDEVRIYDVVLSQSRVEADMGTP